MMRRKPTTLNHLSTVQVPMQKYRYWRTNLDYGEGRVQANAMQSSSVPGRIDKSISVPSSDEKTEVIGSWANTNSP
jgi:hypothetical protein